MDEMKPVQMVYCKGNCGDLLRLSPVFPEPDDGLRNEYNNSGCCAQCYLQMIFDKANYKPLDHVQFENEPFID